MRIQPVILCGGLGSRLWPLSTARRPKQFLPLIEPETMLAVTARRVSDPALFDTPIVVGGSRYETLMRESIPNAAFILEPFGRNSAAAISAAVLRGKPDSIQLVLPADHDIADLTAFHAAIKLGFDSAGAGRIVTFGIEPSFPATGNGYIQAEVAGAGVMPVKRFVEKPDLAAAEDLIARGDHYWNAGIFMFQTGVMRAALERHAPDILASVASALEGRVSEGAAILDAERFAQCRSESIDYALMEAADNISVIPVSMGWSDIGDHAALAEVTNRNRPSGAQGPVIKIDSENSFARSDGPVVGLYGVPDLAVVANNNAVLVTRLDKAAGIKKLVEDVDRHSIAAQVTPALRRRVGKWLYEQLLPHWLASAGDVNGGFVEALATDGSPLSELPRRGRVAPRQIFAFSEAVLRGWDPNGAASELVEKGVTFLDTRARAPNGGWVTLLASDGTITDAKRSLYDHAFVAMAGAHAYRATGSRDALSIANEAFDFIDLSCRDLDGIGWFDPDGAFDGRFANPHMHLLEAALIMFEATSDPRSIERAEEIACLFEEHMFSSATGAMFEDYDSNWTVVPSLVDGRVEPGHCYEWAYLLKRLDALSGRDTRSWCNRLVSFADRVGVGPSGRVLNAITQSGEPINPNSRLWPQLERIRAKLHVVEASAPGTVDNLLINVFEEYVAPAKPGLWHDELDPAGASIRGEVPASMLYHFATAFAPIAIAPGADRE